MAMRDLEASVSKLYRELLSAWNRQSATEMASLYADQGSQVGFDGSTANGQHEIETQLSPIFEDHPTARYVGIVREVRALGPNVAILRAVAGMVPPNQAEIKADRNSIQTLVASRGGDGQDWQVEMFHNTPAAFDGRPQEREKLTQELAEELEKVSTESAVAG